MGNRRRNKGQTLIEVAVVLPLVCLAIVVTVQMIAFCHNAVLLQKMAFQTSRDLSASMRTTPAWLIRNPLWGRGAAPCPHRSTSILNPWRSFRTRLCPRVSDPGHVTTVDVDSVLLPTMGFGSDLMPLHQTASAEAYLEPPIPQQN